MYAEEPVIDRIDEFQSGDHDTKELFLIKPLFASNIWKWLEDLNETKS